MSTADPIPRSIRRSDVLSAASQVLYGPFDWVVFDTADVAVKIKTIGTDGFVPLDPDTFTVSPVDTLPGMITVTLDTAPATGSTVRTEGSRTHERTTDVTRAGVVRSVPLEGELDRITIVLQEIRRDMDQALAPDAALASAEAAVALATAEIAAIRDAAIAARDVALQAKVDATAQVAIATAQAVIAAQARVDAQAAAASVVSHDSSSGVSAAAAAASAALAAGYAAALGLTIDYGFVADAPTETRDYGTVV